MSNDDIDGSDHTVQITHALIDDLDLHLGWDDKPRSYRLLMAVLHAMWEWSSVKSSGDPAAGFPLRLCGTSHGQWQASTTAFRALNMADFIARVNLWFKPDPIEGPLAAIRTVLDLLFERVGEDEIGGICCVLPAELRQTRYLTGRAMTPCYMLDPVLPGPVSPEVIRVQA